MWAAGGCTGKENKMFLKTIAVDFDGTLADTDVSKIYSPNMKLINYLIDRKKAGDKIILWTCREGSRLKQAVEYCESYGLTFDAVNDNLTHMKLFGLNPRKVAADIYIDDMVASKEDFGLPYKGEK